MHDYICRSVEAAFVSSLWLAKQKFGYKAIWCLPWNIIICTKKYSKKFYELVIGEELSSLGSEAGSNVSLLWPS